MNGLLVQAMLIILSAWAILLPLFIGVGLLIRYSFGSRITSVEGILTSFWMGWVGSIFFLQVWHLWFRIDWHALGFVAGVGLIGLLYSGKDLVATIRERYSGNWLFGCILLCIALCMANRSLMAPTGPDDGLYHLSSLRWISSYPVVPGIGNLHGRLAFNNAYFLYVAMLDVGLGPWSHRACHFANGLLLWVLLSQIVLSIFSLYKGSTSRHHLFNVMLMAPALRLSLMLNISTPKPDFAVDILGMLISSQLFMLVDNATSGSEKRDYMVFCIATLALAGVITKQSFCAFGGAAYLLAIIAGCCRRDAPREFNSRHTLMWIGASTLIALVPWIARNVIMSGYIAYPLTWGSVPVDWRIPRASVINMANVIHTYGRMEGVPWSSVSADWSWLKPWAIKIKESMFDVMLPLGLTCAGCSFILGSVFLRRRTAVGERMTWIVAVPPAASLIFWFLESPSVRFAGASFWVLAAVMLTVALGPVPWARGKTMCTILCIGGVLLFLAKCISGERVLLWRIVPKGHGEPAIDMRKTILLVAAGKDRGFYRTPRIKLKKYVTRSGLVLYTPSRGEQCWDAPLPCTPYPHPNLRLRDERDMRYGFMVVPFDDRDPGVGMAL